MPPESGGPPESDPISGRLSETPLFVVVRRLGREALSGTLSVIRGDQVRQLIFENGELCAARSSREEHRIGATLVRWGYISEEDLRDALETQKRTLERLDRILVEKGVVTRVVVDSEARRQMEQIVFSTLGWPDGTFHFEADTGAFELDVPISLSQEMIIEGIRRIPESEQFTELLGDLSGIPWLTRDPLSTGSLKLLRDAVEVLSRIDGRTSLRDLLESSAASGSAGAKILYSLLFAGVIEVRRPGEVPPAAPKPIQPIERRKAPGRRAEDRRTGQYVYDMRKAETFRRAAETGVLERAEPPPEKAPSAPRGPVRSPREVVLELYRQLDWLSHYDLLGVPRKATQAEIEEAYRAGFRLFDPSLKAHPELVDCWRQLTVLSKWLRVAYDVLSRPETRRLYDQKIDAAIPGAPAEPDRKE
ncbi:MAG: DUF4388 domain-containing protein [Thermoanaerobaculia bacterium]